MRGIAVLLVTIAAVAATDCPPSWPPEVLLPHEDCHKFYRCVWGRPVEMTCPEDLYFNEETWQCDWKENVECGDRTTPGEDTTTTSATTPTTPTTAATPTTTTDAPTTTPEKDCPPSWPPEVLLPHEDCHKFYRCVWGRPVEMTCPGDLYFNEETWQCDWKENVECGNRNTPEPTTE